LTIYSHNNYIGDSVDLQGFHGHKAKIRLKGSCLPTHSLSNIIVDYYTMCGAKSIFVIYMPSKVIDIPQSTR